jgi:hypothetical protein
MNLNLNSFLAIFSIFLTFIQYKCLCLSRNSFFPYGIEAGDEVMFKNDDEFVGPILINTNFAFFNKSYSSLFVNTNGLISFNVGVSSFTPVAFPLREIIGVAPFWNDIDTRKGGDIFYREVLDANTLNIIGNDIRRVFADFSSFRPLWAYIVTWVDVAAFSGNTNKKNTFQAVVVTNGRNSFTIFNYETLEWSVSNNINQHAQAGFNAGDQINYFVLEGSFSIEVVNLTRKTNVGIPGKWIFRIDDSSIEAASCNSTQVFLTTYPIRVSSIGGENLLISGPCFAQNDSLELVFDNTINQISVQCELIDLSQCVCTTPNLDVVGRLRLRLVVNNNRTYDGYILTSEMPIVPELNGLEPYYESLLEQPVVRLEWKDSSNQSMYDLYLNTIYNGNFESKLIREGIVGNVTRLNMSDLFLETIEYNSEIPIARYYLTLTRKERSNRNIQFNLKSWFKKFGFYVKIVGTVFASCESWHSQQPDPEPYLNGLPPCWPTIANGIGVNFTIDPSCNQNNPNACRLFHKGAKVCYRSIATFTLGSYTARQQCCYDNNNRLLVGPPGGGTLDMGHAFLMHILLDVVPYFKCCIFSNNCDKYYEKRPSEGTRWRPPPTPGGGSGDPHFTSLDKVSYSFNGFGEYTLLEIKEINFTAQVRLAPFVDKHGNFTDGTVFKAIAIQGGRNVDKLQFELNSQNELLFCLNDRFLNPDDQELLFESGSVALNGVLLNIQSNRIFVNYENGVSFEIVLSDSNDAFFVLTYISEKFKRKTRGLLGVMDDNKLNDFTLPNGNVLQLDPENDREIFAKFGQEWLTKNETSVFTYAKGLQHSSYVNLIYTPSFISDGIRFNNLTLEQLAIQKCGNNSRCLYDVSVTGELNIGNLTLEFEHQIVQYEKEIDQTRENACPSITIENGQVIKDTNELTYSFSCLRGFELNGPSKLKCLEYSAKQPKCKEIKTGNSGKSHFTGNALSFVTRTSITCLILFFKQMI